MKQNKIMLALLIVAVSVAGCKKNEDAPKQSDDQQNPELAQKPLPAANVVKKQDDTLAAVSKKAEEQVSKNPGDYTLAFSPDGQYTLQLSSWKTRKYAEQDRLRFFDAGFDCRIDEVVLPETGQKWYRVRLGSFQTRKAARDFADKYINDLLEEPAWIDYK